MGLPLCRSRVASAQAATVLIAPPQDAHMAIYPGGCHGCCLAACLGCGKRPKVSSQATCLDFASEETLHLAQRRGSMGRSPTQPTGVPLGAASSSSPAGGAYLPGMASISASKP